MLTYFGLHWARLGYNLARLRHIFHYIRYPLESMRHFLDTILATLGTHWASLGTSLEHPWSQSPKTSKKTFFWVPFLEPFGGNGYMQSDECSKPQDLKIWHTFHRFHSLFSSTPSIQTHIKALFMTPFSRPQKNKNIEIKAELRRGHLWHISDKGGTEASGRYLGILEARAASWRKSC